MAEGVDVKELLQAVMRRGGYNQPSSPSVGDFETVRQLSVWTGAVFPQQQVILKRNAMLILDRPSVTIMIDTEKRTVAIEPGPRRDTPEVRQRLNEMVFQVLGKGWAVTCGTIKENGPRRSRKSAQRKGKRRSGKAR